MLHCNKEAREMVSNGVDPDSMVHIIYYPDGSLYGLSSPITREEWSKGGYTSQYFALSELL